MHKDEAARGFALLANPDRVKICKMLYNKGDLSYGELLAMMPDEEELKKNLRILIEISKNDGDFIRLNNNTSARHTIGQKRRYDVIFFNLSIIICHLLRLLSLHFPVIIHFLPILRLSHHLVRFPCESRYEAFLLLRMK